MGPSLEGGVCDHDNNYGGGSHDIMGRGVIMWRQHGMGMITSHDNGYDHVIKYGRGVVMSHVGDKC